MSEVKENPVDLVDANPSVLFTGDVDFKEYYSFLQKNVALKDIDLGTRKGRDEIRSVAYRIAQAKTAIDKAGKSLNEDAQAKITKVNIARNEYKEKLQSLQAEVRKPLDDWEAQESARIESHKSVIDQIKASSQITIDDTSDTISGRISWLNSCNTSSMEMQEFSDEAKDCKVKSLEILTTALERTKREESEKAELEQLREAALKRAAEDALRQQEQDLIQKKADEEQRLKLYEERRKREIAEAEQRAAEKAKSDAEAKAEADRAELILKQQQVEQARLDEEAKAKSVADARAADVEHRRTINASIVDGLFTVAAIPEAKARKIVQSIASGEIPNISINY